MTFGSVALLTPMSQQWGRRGLGFLVALLSHIVLLASLVAFRGLPDGVLPPATAPESQSVTATMVLVPPLTMPAPETLPAQDTSTVDGPEPIAYATGPAEAQSHADWRDHLSRALALQAQGLNAPSYVVENLDKLLVATLVERGLAIVVTGRLPFDDGVQRVHWTDGGATGMSAFPVAWLQQAARRVLPLPRTWLDAAQPVASEPLYLLISANLDAAILAAQRPRPHPGPTSGKSRRRLRISRRRRRAQTAILTWVESVIPDRFEAVGRKGCGRGSRSQRGTTGWCHPASAPCTMHALADTADRERRRTRSSRSDHWCGNRMAWV